MLLRILIICSFLHSGVYAFTVRSIIHGNWEDASTWSNNQVPTNPDSIIISHYITINQDRIINSPTVVFNDLLGTICGDYLLNVSCGASLINYGHIYLNQMKIRAGLNYNRIECKTFINVSGCPPSGGGYFNTYSPGVVLVWPPVFCKTPDTNWEIGTVGLMELENNHLKLYPNPIRNELLTIITLSKSKLKLMDALGKCINADVFENHTEINFSTLSSGLYFLELEIDGKTQTKKIVKTD